MNAALQPTELIARHKSHAVPFPFAKDVSFLTLKGKGNIKGKTFGLPLKNVRTQVLLSTPWWQGEGPKSTLSTFWGRSPDVLVVEPTGIEPVTQRCERCVIPLYYGPVAKISQRPMRAQPQ